MFKVRHKETGVIRTVYGVVGAMFLFYYSGGWFCEGMNKYEPLEGC